MSPDVCDDEEALTGRRATVDKDAVRLLVQGAVEGDGAVSAVVDSMRPVVLPTMP